MTTKKYILLKDRFKHKAGTEVYDFSGYDYGLTNDDTRITGKEHLAVTLQENGALPFFTVPIEDLKEAQQTVTKRKCVYKA